jgi:imidazole glycerol-phosphate synthase subunit HisF
MLKNRVIPCLLLKEGGLVKTVKFSRSTYIGDPINAVRIFNEKEVDELIFLDIEASKQEREPDYEMIYDLTVECFMPFAYGGGIKNLQQIRKLLKLGVEKVIINSSALKDLNLVREASRAFGSSTIVVAMDVKKNLFGKPLVYDHVAGKSLKTDPVEYARQVQQAGAGELFINNVDRDGTCKGYDLEIVSTIAQQVNIPVIACGGAGKLEDMQTLALEAGVGVAAGSLFVFQGPHKAVLINYPKRKVLEETFN